jgi:hypothetical protein
MSAARRTFAHGPEGGWSAIAVHLEAAPAGKEGFYLSLFPDGRPPAVVFLRPNQLSHLVEMAASSTVTDTELWEVVAKIPLEPLLPSRTLALRLRALLVDCTSAIREQARVQAERIAAMPPPPPVEEPAPSSELVPPLVKPDLPH